MVSHIVVSFILLVGTKDLHISWLKNKVLEKLLEMLLEEIEAEESKPTPIKDEPRELIKGIDGLAEFLSCGTTKAQNIMNSGILQERGIAYRAGNRWRFNKTLLTRLLEEEPEILNGVSTEAA